MTPTKPITNQILDVLGDIPNLTEHQLRTRLATRGTHIRASALKNALAELVHEKKILVHRTASGAFQFFKNGEMK